MAEILTIGEILVEVMAKEVGQKFTETGEFQGPFPSGAPAIFIDQAAKLGSSSRILSKVGDDGFGRINVNRLKEDGVDVSHIGRLPDRTTGIAFVTYKRDGGREFIYTIKESASAFISRDDLSEELFEGCKYLHIAGCSAFNNEMMSLLRKSIIIAKQKNIQISFDPNIRQELMENRAMKQFVLFALDNCDIFLPGQEELRFITGNDDEKSAVQAILDEKASCVVVKRGSKDAADRKSVV